MGEGSLKLLCLPGPNAKILCWLASDSGKTSLRQAARRRLRARLAQLKPVLGAGSLVFVSTAFVALAPHFFKGSVRP